ncbi:Small ubiquitin-related modifier [Vanrija albida]|uniref:Small ubiquitin-related modifier n=1 Tax=Vanrija albida TaxID=181172 RepID=A0ABR3Q540_9TREE
MPSDRPIIKLEEKRKSNAAEGSSVVKRRRPGTPRTRTIAPDSSDDDSGEKDIKPKLDNVPKEGIDFKYTREPTGRTRAPDALAISLQGEKDGVGHKIELWLPPSASVRSLKKYLVAHYGYSLDKLRLILDGKICMDKDTMASLDVEHGDAFDVYLEQLGG